MKKLKSTSVLIIIFLIPLVLLNCKNKTKDQTNTEKETQEVTYSNPILGGDYADPSIVRVGADYYMTHSSFNYYPGLLIWHSTDLIHWERISYAITKNIGSVWAPDIVYVNDKYYIYFPAGGTNWVVYADSPKGPWSEPVDLKLNGYIDPGHLLDDKGNRYLYLSKGYIVKLTADGLAIAEAPVSNYEGWQFPKEWITECFCLESPKSTVKDGYYYMTTAEGGTAGPATAHMAVSARSKSPYGPFENSPYNPIVHTENRSERWWNQGHGTLVDDVNGDWWIVYHGYEKHFQTLGRQTLMLPIEWTEDGWFKVPDGVNAADQIVAPNLKPSSTSYELSDNFDNETLNFQWQFYKDYNTDRIDFKDGAMVFKAKGKSFEDSFPLAVNSSDKKYEVQIEYTVDKGVEAGLCLYYNEVANMHISVTKDKFTVYNRQRKKISEANTFGNHGFLRILNDENEVSFYYSANGKDWKRLERSIEASGFNHNSFGEFLNLRAGVFAFGEGKVVFDNFIYKALK
ncbi:family 43 glycosylhydrolase [Mariniflexile litorale]|uniref:Family 43 glycosylhydrolase n=1 Tax=Mariniflexile litorale TaxID=3045158 RepID=A0AAU7EKM0_9FLAO|nr:family 43 glycosylhydrolase [Mariniflexile sp. KMM 9835]MDQ8210597.1 family 43 glycosylhydrolase [Mariniflexile sp. KMM 9835]